MANQLIETLKEKLVKVIKQDRNFGTITQPAPRVLEETMTIRDFINRSAEYSESRLNETTMLFRNGMDWYSIDDLIIWQDGVSLVHSAGSLFLTPVEAQAAKAKIKVVLQ